ncbi:MAG: hypothetical protein KY468_01715 [Armatimonadetes bacterium]|nr:hypothetical protein [Armatimonadota bacterium]
MEAPVSVTPETHPSEIRYVTDADGNPVGVIVPIDLWREIESERETAYLLKSESMKQRLLEAKARGQDQVGAHIPRGRQLAPD